MRTVYIYKPDELTPRRTIEIEAGKKGFKLFFDLELVDGRTMLEVPITEDEAKVIIEALMKGLVDGESTVSEN